MNGKFIPIMVDPRGRSRYFWVFREAKMNGSATGAGKDSTGFARAFLILLLVGITLLFLYVIRRFIMPALLAAITAALFYPLYRAVAERLGRPRLAATATTMLLVVVLLIPVAAFGYLAVDNLIALARMASRNVDVVVGWTQSAAAALQALPIFKNVQLDQLLNSTQLLRMIQGMDQRVLQSVGNVVGGAAQIILLVFIYLYCLYYFLKDGPGMIESVFDRIPLARQDKQTILGQFVSVTRATIKGTVVMGLLQGAIGGGTMAILGLRGSVLAGVMLFFLAAIPNFGAILVWLPASILLLAAGQPGRALVMLLVGGGLIASLDYVVRPRLIGNDTQVHSVLVLFGVLGGLAVFGIFGLIIGPIIVAIFVQIWQLYSQVFRNQLESGE